MNKVSTINKVYTIWEEFSKKDNAKELQFELDVYKKLLRFFQVGDYFYLILNFNTLELDIVSAGIENVLGYRPSEFNIQAFLNCIHPEDQVWFTNFEHETAQFVKTLSKEKLFDYKIQYDLRMRKKDGSYVRILNQVVTIQQYEGGGVQRTLGLYTNITHLKTTGKPTLSFVCLNDGPSYMNIKLGKKLVPQKEVLSKREKEILRLIIEGKQNKEIAKVLFLSKQTIDKHRNNMLNKTNSKNSSELIANAITNGWI